MKRSGIIFGLLGPAGSGKTTLARLLVSDPAYGLSLNVSLTSRTPRPGEVNGESYHFITREEFMRRVAAGDFYEWEEIHGNLYGTLRSFIMDKIDRGEDLLLAIDIKGSLSYKRNFPTNTVLIFVAPPSSTELIRRLKMRPGSTDADISRRLATARGEYEHLLSLYGEANSIDYFVVNDDLKQCEDLVCGVVKSERAKFKRYAIEDLRKVCLAPATVVSSLDGN